MPKKEPKPGVLAETAAPDWLPDEAVAFWGEIGPMLISGRVLTEFDRPALVALCSVYAKWRESYERLQDEGDFYETFTEKGGRIVRPHPAAGQEAERWKRFRLMLIEFGMTPAARSRVAREGADEDDDPVAQWLNG